MQNMIGIRALLLPFLLWQQSGVDAHADTVLNIDQPAGEEIDHSQFLVSGDVLSRAASVSISGIGFSMNSKSGLTQSASCSIAACRSAWKDERPNDAIGRKAMVTHLEVGWQP